MPIENDNMPCCAASGLIGSIAMSFSTYDACSAEKAFEMEDSAYEGERRKHVRRRYGTRFAKEAGHFTNAHDNSEETE